MTALPARQLLSLAAAIGLLLATTVAAAPGLRDFQGQARDLQEFTGSGRWLVVMIWASDCPICNREIGQYVELHRTHGGRELDLLGVSIDGAAREFDAEFFIERYGVEFPNLIGEPETVAGLFASRTGAGFRGTPTFLLFDPEGGLRAAQAGAVPAPAILAFIERAGSR